MTKREKFEVIGKVFGELENANKDEILEFVNKEIAALDAKSAKASKKAAEKRVAGNELGLKIRDVVFAANEPMTIADIINQAIDPRLRLGTGELGGDAS